MISSARPPGKWWYTEPRGAPLCASTASMLTPAAPRSRSSTTALFNIRCFASLATGTSLTMEYAIAHSRMMTEWSKSACILCECNCGIEISLDGRRLDRIRGDKDHPASAGYTCEKALRLDHYQN